MDLYTTPYSKLSIPYLGPVIEAEPVSGSYGNMVSRNGPLRYKGLVRTNAKSKFIVIAVDTCFCFTIFSGIDRLDENSKYVALSSIANLARHVQ